MSHTDLLIPLKKFKPGRGTFSWPRQALLGISRNADLLPLRQLADDLQNTLKVKPSIVLDAVTPATCRIHRDHRIAHTEEYRININPDGIEIFASHNAGAFYAVQTLRDMLTAYGRNIPVCQIKDWPDFKRRGVFHDCSRGKVPKVSTIKALIERISHWKINELQLYVENVFEFKRHPKIGKGFSPFSVEEIIEIQDYCKLYHIALVPTLASFGHMEKILAIPQYRHLSEGSKLLADEYPGFLEHPGGTTICPGDPGSIKFIAELYEEYLPLFEAEDFNVCCDETWELGRGRSKNRANRLGIGRIYNDYMVKIHKLCQKHGKRMNCFGDIILEHDKFATDALKDSVLLHWEYEENGQRLDETDKLVELGSPVVICPGTSAWLSHGTRLSNAMNNVAKFSAQGRKYQTEGMLNMNWGDFGHRNALGVSLHGIAHGAAHSWNGRAVQDKNFTELFCRNITGSNNPKLAEVIRVLGNTYLVVNRELLYHSLVESIIPKRDYFKKINKISPVWMGKAARNLWIDRTDVADLQTIISQLAHLRKWTPPKTDNDEFIALMFKELLTAVEMEDIACHRAIAAKRTRSGANVSSREFTKLADRTARLARDFETLWLARNKPSRLRDNLTLFTEAQLECRDLAKG